MRTITTRQQVLRDGKVKERVATHIVMAAHGYEKLSTCGYNVRYNVDRELVHNCEKLAEGELPITCPTCFVVWHDVHKFKPAGFDTESGRVSFADTSLTEITIGQLSELDEE